MQPSQPSHVRPPFGVGFGQVLHQDRWVADVLYDILYEYSSPSNDPTVRIYLHLRYGQLFRLVHRPDVVLRLMNGTSYSILLTSADPLGYFAAAISPTALHMRR